MTKLIINRSSEYSNKVRDFRIYLNNEEIGRIEDGETKSFEIEPKEHRLVAKIDWCTSNEIKFNLNQDEVKEFNISGTNPFLALYYITFGWKKYLKLQEVV